MRNIGTIKNLPTKAIIDGAYRNVDLGLISFVVNGEAVLTVQDKNFGATNYFQYIRLDGQDVASIPQVTGNDYKRQDGETIQEQLEGQSLIPDGYHVFNDKDYEKIISIIGREGDAKNLAFDKYWRLLIPYSPIGTDAPIGEDYYGCGWAVGGQYKRIVAREPYQIRLAKNDVVSPFMNKKWKNITNQEITNLTTTRILNWDLTTTDYGLTWTTNYNPATDGWTSGTGYYTELTNNLEKCISLPSINSSCVYYFWIRINMSLNTSGYVAPFGLRIIGTNITRVGDNSNECVRVGFRYREDDFEQRQTAFKEGNVEIYFNPIGFGYSYYPEIKTLYFDKTI